jgi:hypothetical protein
MTLKCLFVRTLDKERRPFSRGRRRRPGSYGRPRPPNAPPNATDAERPTPARVLAVGGTLQ